MINKELQKRILSSIILFPIAYYFFYLDLFYFLFLTICFVFSFQCMNGIKWLRKLSLNF